MQIIFKRPRTRQPSNFTKVSNSPLFGHRIIDSFYGNAHITSSGKRITKTSLISVVPTPSGNGINGVSNAGFSFPCDLSSQNAITIVIQYFQRTRSGTQVIFEHSTNQNTNVGTFILYTDSTTGNLLYGTSISGGYDAGSITAPPLNTVSTLAIRLRFTSSAVTTDDIGLALNGSMKTTTGTNSTAGVPNFGNFSTYFLGRGASSLFADAAILNYAVLSGFSTDAELIKLSENSWQLWQSETRVFTGGVAVSLPTLGKPLSNTSAGSWTSTEASLHEAIDEPTYSDADYISVASASTCEMVLDETLFPSGANQELKYRASSVDSSNLTVELFQGGTVIMTRTHSLTPSIVEYTQTLTSGEIATIISGAISVRLTSS